MISDEELQSLREALDRLQPGQWKASGLSHVKDADSETYKMEVAQFNLLRTDSIRSRDFAVLARNLLPSLLARLEFAERCLKDLHDETAAAEAVLRYRKALEEIHRVAGSEAAYEMYQIASEALGPLRPAFAT